jgi:ABC-type arginine/histidine transport system permease subunit
LSAWRYWASFEASVDFFAVSVDEASFSSRVSEGAVKVVIHGEISLSIFSG